MKTILLILLLLVLIKSVTIGSDFDFSKWIKFGKKYTKAYFAWVKLKPTEFNNQNVKIFTPEFLREIGFTLVHETKSEYHPYMYFGRAKDKIGMTHICWNEEGHSCTYFGDKLKPNTSVEIRKDGDTRTAFNGYVFTQDEVRLLLKLTL